MSQRDSGYERKPFDLYETPEWVTQALVPHLHILGPRLILEPACGSGKMARALLYEGFLVSATDIQSGKDFFARKSADDYDGIVTNPPYSHATEFVSHALELMREKSGLVAMLLRTDFDHAKGRAHLFAKHPAFAKKVVLTKRIVWFEEAGKKAAPSYNHAWFIWDWANDGRPPVLAYDLQDAA